MLCPFHPQNTLSHPPTRILPFGLRNLLFLVTKTIHNATNGEGTVNSSQREILELRLHHKVILFVGVNTSPTNRRRLCSERIRYELVPRRVGRRAAGRRGRVRRAHPRSRPARRRAQHRPVDRSQLRTLRIPTLRDALHLPVRRAGLLPAPGARVLRAPRARARACAALALPAAASAAAPLPRAQLFRRQVRGLKETSLPEPRAAPEVLLQRSLRLAILLSLTPEGQEAEDFL